METTTTAQQETPISKDQCHVVYNHTFGGFGLSKIGLDAYNELRIARNLPIVANYYRISRTDPQLVEVVRTLGSKADDEHSSLAIESIHAEFEHFYHIDEYDGSETVRCDLSALVTSISKSYDPDQHSSEENILLLKRVFELAKSDTDRRG